MEFARSKVHNFYKDDFYVQQNFQQENLYKIETEKEKLFHSLEKIYTKQREETWHFTIDECKSLYMKKLNAKTDYSNSKTKINNIGMKHKFGANEKVSKSNLVLHEYFIGPGRMNGKIETLKAAEFPNDTTRQRIELTTLFRCILLDCHSKRNEKIQLESHETK